MLEKEFETLKALLANNISNKDVSRIYNLLLTESGFYSASTDLLPIERASSLYSFRYQMKVDLGFHGISDFKELVDNLRTTKCKRVSLYSLRFANSDFSIFTSADCTEYLGMTEKNKNYIEEDEERKAFQELKKSLPPYVETGHPFDKGKLL